MLIGIGGEITLSVSPGQDGAAILPTPGANTPLNDKLAHDVDPHMLMEAEKVIDIALACIAKDTFEILPGMSKTLKLMSRLAPEQVLKQFGKMVDALQ